MSSIDGKGYKLPAETVVMVEDDMACAVVYYPNEPEYRQALMGSLFYLGTWAAWQRDPLKRGRIAAANWKVANDLTLECIEMSCFDEIVNAINNLRVTVSVNCYCDYLTIEPPTIAPPSPIPGIGDVPTTYGEDDTTGLTWAEYQEYICAQAHAYVDYIKAQNEHLADLLGLGVLALGVVAALIAVVSGFGIAVLVTLGSAAVIFQALIASPGAVVFAGVSDELEAARDDIVNAIVCNNGTLRAVIEGAINETAYDLFYRWVDWERATTILRTGEYDGQLLDHLDPSETCGPCEPTFLEMVLNFEQATDLDYIQILGITYEDTIDSMRFRISQATPTSGSLNVNAEDVADYFSLDPATTVKLLSWEVGLYTLSPYTCSHNIVSFQFRTTDTPNPVTTETVTQSGINTIDVVGNVTEEAWPDANGTETVFRMNWAKGVTCDGNTTFVYLNYVKLIVEVTEP